ncbi:uridine phosphorylase [Muriicola jejuensis]|uniref:Uridine phosphorylase n=1 Tax=Muriicola jejuensis TaxID=504488 RepID=A0A6P0UJW4_9FLAO|nr:nucleoside phosphorylase [Muriicola jejuensis]NER11343.1 phosphorylase [Muriicola jejuensis]SMP21287.1 uridine phosphorylase [Muriicola jejuensis]
MHLGPSELILNQDGSVYHLNLLPEDIAHTVILVGDPDRVERVSRHFDQVEIEKRKREFITHTGRYKGKRLSVLSTGIGTDNIDIVLNELDALVNIDLVNRKVHKNKQVLNFIRIGTSGAVQAEIPVDSFLLSEYALGFDSVLRYYRGQAERLTEFEDAFMEQTGWDPEKSRPYAVSCSEFLLDHFTEDRICLGFTGSNVGFYGPQGRHLRLQAADPKLHEKLASFSFQGRKLTNFEMETSALYGLSSLMGHRAISMNAIIANRATTTFSKNPRKTVDQLIKWSLDKTLLL